MRKGLPTTGEKAVNKCALEFSLAWVVGDAYKVREALVNLNIAVRNWHPEDPGQLRLDFGE